MKILALDTATEGCSAALLINGELTGRELELGRGHAEHILPMIDELLAQGQMSLSALDAIAFGRGPGGFTGVRLATSVTQGLAFGAGLPVVPVSDLMAVAQRVFGTWPGKVVPVIGEHAPAGGEHPTPVRENPPRVIVCNDARMRELYWACFEQIDGLARLVGDERVSPPSSVAIPEGWTEPVIAAGRGFAAYPQLRSLLEPRLADIHDRVLPRAHEIALLAVPMLQKGGAVPPERAAPVYLRDQVAQPAER
jgi:tRNA threonylcarbamoyladenosine biosynthesis protein TsaB